MKRALIFGVTGQDGSYLAEFLLEKGYEVHGVIRRSSTFNTWRINHIYKDIHEPENFRLHYGDLTDATNVIKLIKKIQPDEIYNLAAQSHVKVSFEKPEYTANVDGLGVLRILEAIKILDMTKRVRLYQASTSELFGKVLEVPQSEKTPFNPRSPYSTAKQYAYWTVKHYRDGDGMFCCNGILFNHESPRRGQTFVTRKITMGLAKIKLGLQKKIYIGNLDAKRDWGYAKEYIESMWLMLQKDKPDDYVIATGQTHSVREFIEEACKILDIEIGWEGSGIDERGIDKKTGEAIVEVDPSYFRPLEVDVLQGDASKAKELLGWVAKTKFEDLVKMMVENDLSMLKNKDPIY